MTTLTIRELRQSWPAAEKALETEEEIIITRDGKAVAKLVRIEEEKDTRPWFDPVAHEARLKEIFGDQVFPDSDEEISRHRADRDFSAL